MPKVHVFRLKPTISINISKSCQNYGMTILLNHNSYLTGSEMSYTQSLFAFYICSSLVLVPHYDPILPLVS